MRDRLWYGTAYYPEYLPMDRMEQDMEMMVRAGFNLIRVAESTWSTWEPREGEFDFSLLRRTLECASGHGLSVVVGTPTYAIPPWLARKYPDLLSETHSGPCRYGPRQNFDLTHPGYRFHAERIIRNLVQTAQEYSCVVGFQLDNETKPYDTCSPRAQALFREWLKDRFGSVENLNAAMGLSYWSNSLGSWEDLPDVRGTINGSLGAEYQAFQRSLVTEFLLWQREILDEYLRPGQFVTHNFDYEWRNYSFGLQPEVDQFEAARAVTVAGCDIYHPGAGQLTGAEIAFGGALARGLKDGEPYFVLETQAQGTPGWQPWPGQLRLQAFAHLASGAQCVEYWHWHSIHNACESYWKGVLSHDFSAGAVYREAESIGRDFTRLSPQLSGLRKRSRAAVMVSSRSQTGIHWFPTARPGERGKNYSDVLRWLCDALYRLNVEYDIIPDTCRDFSGYRLVVLPCLYAAEEDLTASLSAYVQDGGSLVASFRSAFADPYLKIRHTPQPAGLTECLGLRYDRFTIPEETELVSVDPDLFSPVPVTDWMELLEPTTARTVCTYHHPAWDGTPAVTLNQFGKGKAAYLGCCFPQEVLDALLRSLLPEMGISLPDVSFPVILRSGLTRSGAQADFWLNFSGESRAVTLASPGTLLVPEERELRADSSLTLPPWGAAVILRA